MPSLTLALALLIIATAPPAWALSSAGRIEDGKLTVEPEGGKPLTIAIPSELFEPTPIGAIASKGGSTYGLISALPCAKCSGDRSLYLLRAEGSESPHLIVHPGRLVDPSTGQVVLESDAFWGNCLEGRGEVLVVFSRERVDRRRGLQPSVFVAEPGPQYLNEKLIERGLPRIEPTRRRVRRKECFEITGIHRRMTARKINLTPKRFQSAAAADVEGGDEPEPKENQTNSDLPAPQD